MRKAIVTTIVLIVLIPFSACGGTATERTVTERDTLRDQALIECEEEMYKKEALAGWASSSAELYSFAREVCEATLAE